MIREPRRGPVDDVHFNFAGRSAPDGRVLDAIAAARAIVIGPSNPVISIGPILARARDARGISPRRALRGRGVPAGTRARAQGARPTSSWRGPATR
jgi:LPPG:FO 2-phospho-L-lactate transferase